MVDVIVPSRYWILNVLSNGYHAILGFIHHVILIHSRCTIAILLGHLYALFLHTIHRSHCLLLFPFQHTLKSLLLGNGVQRNVGVDAVVVFFDVGEHFDVLFII
jgi:hypothetical protein